MGCIAKTKGHWCLVITNFIFIVTYIHCINIMTLLKSITVYGMCIT